MGPTNDEAIGDEPLPVPRAVVRDRGHVLALFWAASVAAMSELVSEAAGGHEGHNLVLAHSDPAVRIRLMKSSQLFIHIWHNVCIKESFFK